MSFEGLKKHLFNIQPRDGNPDDSCVTCAVEVARVLVSSKKSPEKITTAILGSVPGEGKKQATAFADARAALVWLQSQGAGSVFIVDHDGDDVCHTFNILIAPNKRIYVIDSSFQCYELIRDVTGVVRNLNGYQYNYLAELCDDDVEIHYWGLLNPRWVMVFNR